MKQFLIILLCASSIHAADKHVYFSPKGGCTQVVVENLAKARTNVLVQAYSFTSAPIAKALVDAARRGVKVQVILDKSNRTESIPRLISWRTPIFPPSLTPSTPLLTTKS